MRDEPRYYWPFWRWTDCSGYSLHVPQDYSKYCYGYVTYCSRRNRGWSQPTEVTTFLTRRRDSTTTGNGGRLRPCDEGTEGRTTTGPSEGFDGSNSVTRVPTNLEKWNDSDVGRLANCRPTEPREDPVTQLMIPLVDRPSSPLTFNGVSCSV